MLQDLTILQTGVVFLRVKEDKEISIENVTTLQVVNSGFVPVFVNELEIKSGEVIVLVYPDNTLSNIDLTVKFAEVDTTSGFGAFTWNKKELTIIYKKLMKCKN